DQYASGARSEQWRKHAAGGTAGAREEHALAAQIEAEVAREVGHEPGAIGVVGENAVGAAHQEIRGACALGSRGTRVGERERIDLSGQRHAGAAATPFEESANSALELAALDKQAVVGHGFAHFTGEARMNHGRKAVRDGIADDDVAVHAKAGQKMTAMITGAAACPTGATPFNRYSSQPWPRAWIAERFGAPWETQHHIGAATRRPCHF